MYAAYNEVYYMFSLVLSLTLCVCVCVCVCVCTCACVHASACACTYTYTCRYAQLSDEQFESLLTGDKGYEDLVTPDEAQPQQ